MAGLATLGPIIAGILSDALGFGMQWGAREDVRSFFDPTHPERRSGAATLTTAADGKPKEPAYNYNDLLDAWGLTGENRRVMEGFLGDTAGVSGGAGWVEQLRQNELSQQEQQRRQDATIAGIKTGPLFGAVGRTEAASNRISGLLDTGAEAITQDTMNKIVAGLRDQINADAANRARAATEVAGARGLSPDAVTAIRQGTAAEAGRDIAAGWRETAVKRELANKQYAMDLRTQLNAANAIASGTAGEYQGLLTGQENLRTSLEQPPNLAALSELLMNWDLAKLGMETGMDVDLANQFFGLGGGLMETGFNGLFAKQAAQAQSGGGFFSDMGGPLGALLGATGSLALSPLFPGAPLWATVGDVGMGSIFGGAVGSSIGG